MIVFRSTFFSGIEDDNYTICLSLLRCDWTCDTKGFFHANMFWLRQVVQPTPEFTNSSPARSWKGRVVLPEMSKVRVEVNLVWLVSLQEPVPRIAQFKHAFTIFRAFMNPEEWLLHGCVKGVKPKNIVSKSSVEVYCCPICQVLMESAIDLQKHLFDHVKNQCRICLQMHATKRELTTHMQTEHDSSMPESVFICRFCQRRFLKITALYLHLKVMLCSWTLCVKTNCFQSCPVSILY